MSKRNVLLVTHNFSELKSLSKNARNRSSLKVLLIRYISSRARCIALIRIMNLSLVFSSLDLMPEINFLCQLLYFRTTCIDPNVLTTFLKLSSHLATPFNNNQIHTKPNLYLPTHVRVDYGYNSEHQKIYLPVIYNIVMNNHLRDVCVLAQSYMYLNKH